MDVGDEVIAARSWVSNRHLAAVLEESDRGIVEVVTQAGSKAVWQLQMLLAGAIVQSSPHPKHIRAGCAVSNVSMLQVCAV